MKNTQQSRFSMFSSRGAFLIAVSWGIGVVVTLAIMSAVSGPSQAEANMSRTKPTPVRAGTLPLPNNDPLVGGRRMSITDAKSAARYPILLPDTSAANQANLTQVWMDSKNEVALVFGDGKVMITMMRASYSNPAHEFQAYISQNRYVKASMGRVRGGPALLITPNTDYYKSNPAWVEFCSNGLDINVSSHIYGTATLLAIADSMR